MPAPQIIATETAGQFSGVRLNLRGWIETGLQRLQSSDVALSVHAATSGGGGRITSVAALIGICVSSVGAGTYCVATALLPDPKPAIRAEAKPPKRSTRTAEQRRRETPRVDPSPVRLARRQSTPSTQPANHDPADQPQRSGSRGKTVQADEFSFEQQAAQAASGGATASTSQQSPTSSTSNGTFESGASSNPPAARGEFSDGTGGEFAP